MTALAIAPTSPAEQFHCEHYDCDLTARACVLRQRETRVFKGGTSQGKTFRKVYVPPHLLFCSSGKCEQGAAIAAALEGQHVEKPRDVDHLAQYRARKKASRPILPPPSVLVPLHRGEDPPPVVEQPRVSPNSASTPAAVPLLSGPPPKARKRRHRRRQARHHRHELEALVMELSDAIGRALLDGFERGLA